MNDCNLRPVEEKDIPILYEHLKEFLETPNASTTGNPLPAFADSENFVKKYLFENKHHEYDKWYMVLNDNDEIIGNVFIDKKNTIAYHILENFQKNGYGEKAVELLMEKNPRKVYFAVVNVNNGPSIEFIKKLNFKEKGFIFEKVVND